MRYDRYFVYYLDMEVIGRSFESVFALYYPRLVGYAYKIIQDEPIAQEIAADALIYLSDRVETIQNDKHLGSTLFQFARSRALNQIKWNKGHVTEDVPEEVLDDIDFLNIALDNALYEKLYAAIEALPPRARETIKNLYFQNLSYTQACDHMGCAKKTVDWQRQVALKKLRASIMKNSAVV